MSGKCQTQIYTDCPDCEVREIDQWGERAYTIEKCEDHDGLRIMSDSSDSLPQIGWPDIMVGLVIGIIGYASFSATGQATTGSVILFTAPVYVSPLACYLRVVVLGQ